METPLLKVAGHEEYKTSVAHYGSTGNNQQVSTTGNCQDAGTGDFLAKSARSKQDISIETSQAASPTQGEYVIVPLNPNGRVVHRAKLRWKGSSMKIYLTQVMLILALFASNAAQLNTVLNGGNYGPEFVLLVVFIGLSLILEAVAAVLITLMHNMNDQHHENYDRLKNAVTIVVLIVFGINFVILPALRPQPAINWPLDRNHCD